MSLAIFTANLNLSEVPKYDQHRLNFLHSMPNCKHDFLLVEKQYIFLGVSVLTALV